MAAKDFKPEVSISKTNSNKPETKAEVCDSVRNKSDKGLPEAPLSRAEFYDRVRYDYLPLQGEWISQAGFTPGMPIKIRVMPDCIVITTQNSRELWGCAEGLSVTHFNKKKMNQWIKDFPGALNDTGDIPVIRRESPRYDCLKRGKS
ncbi:SymE family type I addiction module toxin [Cedecea neteri]|uniref:SymE family type I addiction module toxin n=1 Tax=Cedecea neteri TaxID=158822 RepID=UPI0009DDD53F|nr:SymE family type I addiction module toxin [Cedecea neteri]